LVWIWFSKSQEGIPAATARPLRKSRYTGSTNVRAS
jgi:hypothetical protein